MNPNAALTMTPAAAAGAASAANPPRFANVQVGDTLPPVSVPPLSRTTLALYAGASGDHVPLHIDQDVARKAGMPDVFGHGMLTAAWLGRVLTGWVRQQQIRSMELRFTGITHLYNAITCTGRVTRKFEQNGEQRVDLEIQAANQYGEQKIAGVATVALE